MPQEIYIWKRVSFCLELWKEITASVRASFLEMVQKIVGIFQAMCGNALLLNFGLGLGRLIEILCGVQAIWFALKSCPRLRIFLFCYCCAIAILQGSGEEGFNNVF